MGSGHVSTGLRYAGFTLVELIVVVVLLGLLATLGIPELLRSMNRYKVEGFMRTCSALAQKAKGEAVRRNAEAVFQPEIANSRFFAFLDLDGAGPGTPPDGLFNPVAGQPYRTTDYEIGSCRLPAGVQFIAPESEPLIDGFLQSVPAGVAIFDSLGAVSSEGGFRFGDARENYLEILIKPPATARIELRKWDPEGEGWKARGEGGKQWVWY